MKNVFISLLKQTERQCCLFGLCLILLAAVNPVRSQTPPVANSDFYDIHGSRTFTVTLNDYCPGGPCDLVAVNQTQPSHGQLSSASGAFIYTANAGYTGSDSFTYIACVQANNGVCSSPATVALSINNQSPVATDDWVIVRSHYPTDYYRTTRFFMLLNDYDSDDDPFTSAGAVAQNTPLKGIVDGADFGNMLYRPNIDAGGYDE